VADRDILERMDRFLERIDRHMERGNVLMERIDRNMERSDAHMVRGNELVERVIQEFELNREVQVELLARHGESHREVIARLEDLGVHMREQTAALVRIQGRLGPNEA
jgi:hemerythrin